MRIVYHNVPYFIKEKEIFPTSGNMNFVLASGNVVIVPLNKMFGIYNPRDGMMKDAIYYVEDGSMTKFTYDKSLLGHNIYVEIDEKEYKLYNVLGEIVTYDMYNKENVTIFTPPPRKLYYVIYDPTYESYGFNVDLKVYKTKSHVILVKAVLKNFEGVLLEGYKLHFSTDIGNLYARSVITDKYGYAFNMVYIDNLDDMPTIEVEIYE